MLCDHTTVTHGLHDDSVCETDTGAILPPETIRRLCCNGRIVPILLVDGVPVNVGREQRLANRAQRRALRAIYRTCGFAGCETPFNRCEIHHLVPWELGGVTDLANLLPLCAGTTTWCTSWAGGSSSPPTVCSRSDNPTARSTPPNRSRSDQPNAAIANSTTKPNAPDNAWPRSNDVRSVVDPPRVVLAPIDLPLGSARLRGRRRRRVGCRSAGPRRSTTAAR